ncbi:MAG TPA: DUF1453 domain-containing protein [Thermoanaerobaculia bacterium]|nr:DUF1453 domain-containing protein [Thermoanaerobaculia bacterium]
MPLVFVLLAVLLLLVLFVLSVPLSLLQRYRTGTARRPARGWVATVNVVSLIVSTGLFLLTAAVTGLWVADALLYALLGLAVGALLGLLGLAATRWEATPRSLHFTPNRWLVLVLMLVVTARLLYGFWRAWGAWRTTDQLAGWLAEAGLAGSLAAGAVVLGYALAYWAGIRARVQRHGLTPPG